jgi:hypothetical protein
MNDCATDMIKKLLIYVVPFLLPFVVYGIYVLLARRGIVRPLRSGPWVWLLVAGFVLCLLTVGVLAVTGGSEPGREYVPPHVEDGQIKPGTFRQSE